MLDTYSDEFLQNTFAVSILDGEGNDDQRTARVCSTINATVLNALRKSGNQHVRDDEYRTEESYLPGFARKPTRPKIQSWAEMKGALGFTDGTRQ